MAERYSVLVVDDSAFMRKLITDMVSADERFSEVHAARNGLEAVEMTKRLRPSVISMDIEMPVMNGIDALKQIMQQCPTPVIMLSSMTDRGAKETIEALEHGAVDFVKKPSGAISLDLAVVKKELLQKLVMAAQTKIAAVKASALHPHPGKSFRAGRETLPQTFKHVVAIGTSTGGPKALQQVLAAFPAHFPAPILIVQHMPPPFTKSLAERLNALCDIQVVEAEHFMRVQPGTAYIAPGDWHMTLLQSGDDFRIGLNQSPPCYGHRPSVDVMFRSLLPMKQVQIHAVLLTGMGRDGAAAMKFLKQEGAYTIAEAEETCIVYGMPRAAAELNAASQIVPLHDIANAIMRNMEMID